MGLFRRLSDVVVANLNGLIDKVENPERMLAQIIREMEEAIAAARQQAVAVVAGERRLARDLEHQRDAAQSWRERTRLALDNGREDLARRAIARHLEHADLTQALEGQHAVAVKNSAEVQAAVRTLEDRLAEARQQRRLLETRRQANQVQQQFLAAAGAGQDPRSPFARFARLQDRLTELEDDLVIHAAVSSPRQALETDLTQLETDRRAQLALEELKEEQQAIPVEAIELEEPGEA